MVQTQNSKTVTNMARPRINTGSKGTPVSVSEFSTSDQEAELLTDLLDGYKKWTAIGNSEYAEAYRMMLNSFTMKPTTEE